MNLRFSLRQDGDFHLDQDPAALEARRRQLVDLPWSMPDEHHGVDVAEVRHPGDQDRAWVDGLVTECSGAVIGIWVGDCAPVALWGESGRFGGVHVGWRGLVGGILANAVAAIRCRPDDAVAGVIGPCIHACCYEFGAADLERMVARFGPGVAGRTSAGRPALDMPAAVTAALAELGVEVEDRSECTGCNADRWFSHRVRGERERQVMAVWA